MSGYFFLIENDLFCIAKITQLGQAPTSQARPRDTDLSPSNLAGTTLSFVEHTLTKFGGDPCPVRRVIAAAVKSYMRNARFSRLC